VSSAALASVAGDQPEFKGQFASVNVAELLTEIQSPMGGFCNDFSRNFYLNT
jgi:hypothetical protein